MFAYLWIEAEDDNMEEIVIEDAYENNLKHINVKIPLHHFTCVTGCSGCGKSSLVFDTIYAESQRGFLEGITGNLYGQKLMNKPKVGKIENLRPALNVSQNYYNVNPRSTIGTVTEISYYLRALFSVVNSTPGNKIHENVFSSNNPEALCPNCGGLGYENVVSKSLLIPDDEKTLREGAIVFYKGNSESKGQRYLEALCEQYGIDIDKKVSELTKEELYTLLYANDNIKYKISYKEGKRRKQHYVYLNGAVTEICEKLKNTSIESATYSKYIKTEKCHVCNGAKLRPEILNYKVNKLNYFEIEDMEISNLIKWFNAFDFSLVQDEKVSVISQLINSICVKLRPLVDMNVGYLSLNRSIPSLSGGERQRIRIAAQMTCSLRGLIYILDEPCKGLHYRDVNNIILGTNKLIKRGNTVIAIEHNKQYMNAASNIIELGPVGGPDGGYIIKSGKKCAEYVYNFKLKVNYDNKFKYIRLDNASYRNIKKQDVEMPVGGITCVTGVSGSGKTTLTEIVNECVKNDKPVLCDSYTRPYKFRKVINVNQSPIGKTPRSTIISYLGIYDEIRNLFAGTKQAKISKLRPADFSMNVKGGRCECCQGTGVQKIDLNYLPSSYITCPLCDGKRFHEDVLAIKYNGKSILEVLDSPIYDIVEEFGDSQKVSKVLSCMVKLGLGYLKLGQMSMNLSGGEAQRIKLAKALGTLSTGKNFYILDEPTTGLNDDDIAKLIDIIMELQNNGETVVIVEHNIEFVARVSDYIIDFGVQGGKNGGKIVSQGIPLRVFKDKSSSLYGIIPENLLV